eukprot:jgi/Botrbrau1/2574/Bobra.145_1s0002.1
MAFLAGLGEAEGARTLAQRALKTIAIPLEEEKRKVWVELLRLESRHGNPREEAIMTAFNRALPYNDPLTLYKALLRILQDSEMEELAGETLRTMCKRFSGVREVWLLHLTFLIRQGKDEARKLVYERALNALPPKEAVQLTRDVAVVEYHEGSAERGRTLFESVISNYPKRLDLWSVYFDQEIRQGDAARVRSLFERGRQMQIPYKKLKFFYLRLVEFEAQYGDPAHLQHAKRLLEDYLKDF